MTNLLKNKRGVTLVELLAVIIIMGIIAAIAVPTIGSLIENQRIKAADAEWANVLEAGRLYYADTDDTSFTLAEVEAAGYLSETIVILDDSSEASPVGDPIVHSTVTFTVTAGVVSVTAPASIYIGTTKVND